MFSRYQLKRDEYKHPNYLHTGYEEFCPFYEHFFTNDRPVKTVNDEINALEKCVSLDADFNSSIGLKFERYVNDETVLSLYLSGINCLKETVQFMLENGSDPRKIIIRNKPTAIESYISNRAFNMDIFETIDKHVKHTDKEGYQYYLDSIFLYYINHAICLDPDVIRMFVVKGVDINYNDINGYNPLMGLLVRIVRNDRISGYNSSNKKHPGVHILLDNGVNLNTRSPKLGKTPLIMACNVNDNEKMINRMIIMGSDVNERDEDGFKPIMRYMMRKSIDIETVDLLLNRDSDINTRDRKKGMTAFMRFSIRPKQDESIRDLFLSKGCVIKVRGEDSEFF